MQTMSDEEITPGAALLAGMGPETQAVSTFVPANTVSGWCNILGIGSDERLTLLNA
jgi:hypothetical protein